jgi:hypothetical protein
MNRTSHLLPLSLSNLSSLAVHTSWSMSPENSYISPIDSEGLASLNTRADVVLDMFVDPNPNISTQPSTPKYEIMVWIGNIGAASPVGYSESEDLAVYRLGGIN